MTLPEDPGRPAQREATRPTATLHARWPASAAQASTGTLHSSSRRVSAGVRARRSFFKSQFYKEIVNGECEILIICVLITNLNVIVMFATSSRFRLPFSFSSDSSFFCFVLFFSGDGPKRCLAILLFGSFQILMT